MLINLIFIINSPAQNLILLLYIIQLILMFVIHLISILSMPSIL